MHKTAGTVIRELEGLRECRDESRLTQSERRVGCMSEQCRSELFFSYLPQPRLK